MWHFCQNQYNRSQTLLPAPHLFLLFLAAYLHVSFPAGKVNKWVCLLRMLFAKVLSWILLLFSFFFFNQLSPLHSRLQAHTFKTALEFVNKNYRVLCGRKPTCPSSDSHGKPMPKRITARLWSEIAWDGTGSVHSLGKLLLDTMVTPAPCMACGYLNCPQDRHKKCSHMATDTVLRE